MGLTKRFSELFLQSYSAEKNCKTVFSSVRFGNVLGSSGSVIPIFQDQIRKRRTSYCHRQECYKIFYDYT